MAIKPIDLQTLFVKLDEVSRQQSITREQSALQQAQAAKAQVDKEIEEDRRVIETAEDREAEAVKDDEESRADADRRENGNDEERAGGDEEGREIITDPDIGRHVDISG